MTTVQIVGISVATVIVVLLVIALVVTRRKGAAEDAEPAPVSTSFLDDAPQDTLAALGRAEQPMEDVTIDPAVQRAAAARAAEAARMAARETEETPAPGPASSEDEPALPDHRPTAGLGLDWGPDLTVPDAAPPAGAPAPISWDDPDAGPDAGAGSTADPGGSPLREDPAAGEAGAESQASARHMVPLSDIIVTTSGKQVDLNDGEVRRMLTDLVTYEIDQATVLRKQGQTLDAVLQLTEAEKISRALGMTDSAERIHRMVKDMQGQV